MPVPDHWEKVIGITQAAIFVGHLAEDCTCHTVVLIPKGNKNFQGINLVDTLWKKMTRIINHQLMVVIQLHDTLRSFCNGRVTGIASLGDKLIKNIMDMMEEILYEIFLDLQKAYAILERRSCLDIITAYGVGSQDPRIFWRYWDRL